MERITLSKPEKKILRMMKSSTYPAVVQVQDIMPMKKLIYDKLNPDGIRLASHIQRRSRCEVLPVTLTWNKFLPQGDCRTYL